MCGGSGTRLWPLSRIQYPKQFCEIFEDGSLFQKTVKRNLNLSDSFCVVVNEAQFNLCKQQISTQADFILEPVGRNTAPAIALAALNAKENDILLVLPSDHLIKKQDEYQKAIKQALELAEQGFLVTFGIKPSYPETGFGYIESNGNDVTSFKEKPDLETAKTYIESGNYLWNSGMFCFKAKAFLEELRAHREDIFNAVETVWKSRDQDQGVSTFTQESMLTIPSESIDYAVMEKSERVKVIPCDIGWSDLGSFDALESELSEDSTASILNHESSDNFVHSMTSKTVGFFNVKDLIVVDTPDALLIGKKGSTQNVKKIVEQVENKALLNQHLFTTQDYGTVELLSKTKSHDVLKIQLNDEAHFAQVKRNNRQLSVTSGSISLLMGEEEFEVTSPESLFIPEDTKCEIKSTHTETVLIEVNYYV